MASTPLHDTVESDASPSIQVLEASMRIRDLIIERPAILTYLRQVPDDKREIALVHALEVGVTELAARRGRFGH